MPPPSSSPRAPRGLGLLTWILLGAVAVETYLLAVEAFRSANRRGKFYETFSGAGGAKAAKGRSTESDKAPEAAKSDSGARAALEARVRDLERQLKAKEQEIKRQDAEREELELRLLILENRRPEGASAQLESSGGRGEGAAARPSPRPDRR